MGVDVRVGVGVGVGGGVGVADGVVNWTVSIGRLAPLLFSLVSNRIALLFSVSLPRTSHPKSLEGLSSHRWTSAAIWDEAHE
jgi:hypothetical protein